MTTPYFQSEYKVYINHTDAGGIVYHANHLTFFENCRRDWLESLGFDGYFFDEAGDSTAGGKVHFVGSRASLDYKLALHVDDRLIVTIDSIVLKSASLIMEQSIYANQADFEQSKPASTASITLACVHNTVNGLRPYRLQNKKKNAL